MSKCIAALSVALFCCCVPALALAQPVPTLTYNVSGAFNAPATGSFSGSYVVNTSNNTIVSADIRVTGGKATDGTTDLPANNYIYTGSELSNMFRFSTAVPANGLRGGFIAVNGTKSAPTSFASIRDSVCSNSVCSQNNITSSNSRLSTNGTVALFVVAPVPALSGWALMSFGLALAGGAALYTQRRRMTV